MEKKQIRKKIREQRAHLTQEEIEALSLIHILTKEEADVMEGRQDEILNLLNIKR